MSVISISSGSASLILNGNSITEFAEGDVVTLEHINNKVERHYGEGDSVNINERVDARAVTVTFSVMRYGDNDITLSALLNATPLVAIDGSLKENYVKDTVAGVESWTLSNGSFSKYTNRKINNQEGEPMTEYVIECVAKRNV